MADERPGSTDETELPTTEPTGDAASESTAAARTPAPRPSATSRARRIGGLANAPARRSAGGSTDDAVPPAKPPRPPKPPRPADRPAASTTKDVADLEDAGHRDKAEAAETVAEPARADAATGSAGSGRGIVLATWAPAAVLSAAVIAMAVVVAVVSHGVWWGQRYDAPSRSNPLREQVSAAAKTCLARTNSYDYRNLAAFEKAGLACTTGQETAQFRQAVDSIIKVNAVKLKATQSAQINTTGVESVSGTQWTLLVYGQLKVTNTSTPKGRVDPFAAEVRMDKVHGKWLLAAEKVVSQPAS